MKNLRYMTEAALVYTLFALFKIMPLDAASALGGFIARNIGPLLAASRKARRNLERAIPGKSAQEYDNLIRDMWDNLGRVVAEYPHIGYIVKHRITPEHEHYMTDALKLDAPAFLITAHLANWEVGPAYFTLRYNLPLDITYRAPNNPYVDRLLHKTRSMGGSITAFPKARETARKLLNALKDGHNIGFLIDQKFNEGLPVPFFGRDAMTNPAFVQLAQKFHSPLVPTYIVRTDGAHFRLIFGKPLEIFEADGKTPLPLEKVIRRAHIELEDHIRQYPAQWLWLHRRWKD